MKDLLLSEKFTYWPVCSIAFYSLRENILNISLATWYKYVKSLGISRPKIPKKKRYSKSVIAKRPNEYWHADITIVKSLDGIKNYVYLLMDNYSKYIINWKVEPVASGKLRLQTIKDAYKQVSQTSQVKLIIDGGPENNNKYVDDFTHSKGVNIIKLIALKDVPFSNSIVEAQNKLLKYYYLFKQQFYDINELRNKLKWIVDDYNYDRPHI
jgi:putative transposase